MCGVFPVIFIGQHQHFSSDRGHGNVNSIPFVFDFMDFSENWFTRETSIENLEILGYNIVRDGPTYSSGGGVALYLKDGYDFQIREDLNTKARYIRA